MSKLTATIPAAAGIIAGVASSLLVSARDSRDDRDPPRTGAAERTAVREYVTILVPASQNPIEELGRATPTALANSAAAGSSTARSSNQRESLLEDRRITEQRHEQLIRNHREQPVDPSWASSTSALVAADLNDLAKTSSFKVFDAECRTTSCLGTVEWPSYGNAVAEWRRLLHHGYQANCSREITLPEPADHSAPYRASIVLECESWRADNR